MKIGRRTFLLGTGLVAAAPALASLLPRSAITRSQAVRANGPVLRIEGWDALDNAPAASAGDEVWISVSRSWRAAWR